MKKKLGVLVLTLSVLAISAACTTSGQATKEPNPPQPDTQQTWSESRRFEMPARPAAPPAVPAAKLSRR
ncbi:MAG TPA: hypothetical protein VKG01_13240 [Thermoanaerobaculia bacterium]|nr:hypothetical protein [Thermoanaerobaculia bacterium]